MQGEPEVISMGPESEGFVTLWTLVVITVSPDPTKRFLPAPTPINPNV